jgi:hypothetical protein
LFFCFFFVFPFFKGATPNFGQLFSGQPKKLAEIGQFFFLIFEEFRVTKKLAEIG